VNVTPELFEEFLGGFQPVHVACGPWRCGLLYIRSVLVLIQFCCLFLKIHSLMCLFRVVAYFLRFGRKNLGAMGSAGILAQWEAPVSSLRPALC